MKSLSKAVAAMALCLVAACGQGEQRSEGLSPEEDRRLDNAAGMLDNGVFDASPDSLVAEDADNWTGPEEANLQ